MLTATRLPRQAANWGYLPAGEVIRSDMPGTFALALRKPLGVVAGISPWNGAQVLAWRTVVNPVAFGNSVVLKPSEEAPISAGLLVAEIMAEAGFPAADLDYAVEATAFAAFFHSGQICMNARKVLVEQPVYDAFIDRLTARVQTLPADDPAVSGTVIGPLITPAALNRVAAEVDGAVLVAQPVKDADEAVAIANATRYGLSAGLITRDNQRGFALARRIDAGVVHVNDQAIADEPQLPMGRVKDSGWAGQGRSRWPTSPSSSGSPPGTAPATTPPEDDPAAIPRAVPVSPGQLAGAPWPTTRS